MGRKAFNEELKSCNKCRTVWQYATAFVNPYANKSGPAYYKDFPHYGLPKDTCPRCKEVNHACNT